MPIYEFVCPIHGKFEGIFPLSDFDRIANGIFCGAEISTNGSICTTIAKKVFSIPATVQIAKPTLIFRNPLTKEVKLMAREENARNPPRGFIVEEVKGQFERLKLEKELSNKQEMENQIVTERHRQIKDESTKSRHSELNANMSNYDHQTQSLLKAAQKRSKKKELPAKKTEFRFDVSHLNSSNLIK